MKEKLALVLLTLYTVFSFSQVELYSPPNGTNFLSVDSVYFEWFEDINVSGGIVSYDLYFGTETDPPLYYSDLIPSTNAEIATNTYIFQGTVSDGTGTTRSTGIFLQSVTLNHETTYYWKVVAKNTTGVLSTSNTFSFTTVRENTLPTVPNLLSPANGLTDLNATPTLSWSESIDTDGDPVTYRVFIKEDVAGSNNTIGETTETSFTISTALKDSATYVWYVQAIDGYEGASPRSVLSTESSFTVENYQNDAPTKPILTSPANNVKNMGFDVNLAWNASTDADGEPITYDVYADADTDPQTLIASNSSATNLSHTFNQYGTIYWKVVAKDGFGHTIASDIWSFSCWENSPPEQPDMIDVTGGTFTMGQSDDTQLLLFYSNANGAPIYTDVSDENPAHQVTLSDYKIGKYEVTNAQYVDFLNSIIDDIVIEFSENNTHQIKSFKYKRASYKGSEPLCQVFDATRDLSTRANIDYEPNYDSPIIWNGSTFELDENYTNHPIRWMYYTGAKFYGRWLGNYRVPTEAEWEYAAMGGNQSMGYTYSGSDDFNDVAIKSSTSTAPVGTKMPNELGLYDMSGNVAEVCEDYYDPGYYEMSPTTNPINTVYNNFRHVRRGGYFTLTRPPYFRNKRRDRLSYEQYMETSGFRLAKSNNYTVSGKVVDIEGMPLVNVSILGFPNPIVTDANGNYSTTVTSGWLGTLSAYLSGYKNNTGAIDLNNLAENSINNDFILEQKATTFDLNILVTDGTNALDNISIDFDGTDYITDANGKAVINDIPTGQYPYYINDLGFYEAIGTIILSENNLTKTIILQSKTLTVSDLDLEETDYDVLIYPNPSQIDKDFVIRYNGKGIVNIYNTLGQLVYKNTINNSLKVSLQSKGMFSVVLKTQSGVLSKKIIIQ